MEIREFIENLPNQKIKKIIDDLEIVYGNEPIKNKGHLIFHNVKKILELNIDYDYVLSGEHRNIIVQKIKTNGGFPEYVGDFKLNFFCEPLPKQEWADVKYDYDTNMWRLNAVSPKKHYEPRTTWLTPDFENLASIYSGGSPTKRDSAPEEGKGRGLSSGTRIWIGGETRIITYLNSKDIKRDWLAKFTEYRSEST